MGLLTWVGVPAMGKPEIADPQKDEFEECATCRAKPGTPSLCLSCLHNRTLIHKLQALVKTARAEGRTEGYADGYSKGRGDGLYASQYLPGNGP